MKACLKCLLSEQSNIFPKWLPYKGVKINNLLRSLFNLLQVNLNSGKVLKNGPLIFEIT